MSRLLLDTHIAVWLAIEPTRIPPKPRSLLAEAEEINVSAATAYELAQKSRLGKLPQADAILSRWEELLLAMGANELPMTARDMARAGSIAWEHRDPFDRMLVAQAQLHGLALVTKDATIRAFDGVVCADWI